VTWHKGRELLDGSLGPGAMTSYRESWLVLTRSWSIWYIISSVSRRSVGHAFGILSIQHGYYEPH
jgi:hypothetical protein